MALLYLLAASLVAGTMSPVAWAINGGIPVGLGELPYVVSVRNARWGHTCSGSLIAPNVVLTSAVCAQPTAIANMTIVAGTMYSANVTEGEQIKKPSSILQHPDLVFPLPEADISLVFFEEPFELNENVATIALPPSDAPFSETLVRISGWGVELYGGPLSEVLMTVISDVFTDEECAAFMNREVEEQIICTGGRLGNAAACQGDAGTGIVSTGADPYIVSVVSHFPCETIEECDCGAPGPKDHSPEISYYLDWINEQIAAWNAAH